MANNYNDDFENIEFDEGLGQILEAIFDETHLVVCAYDVRRLNDEHNDDVNRVIIGGAVQEPLDSTETCHDPENVTGTASSRGLCVGNAVHTVASGVSERTSVENTSVVHTTHQYGTCLPQAV